MTEQTSTNYPEWPARAIQILLAAIPIGAFLSIPISYLAFNLLGDKKNPSIPTATPAPNEQILNSDQFLTPTLPPPTPTPLTIMECHPVTVTPSP